MQYFISITGRPDLVHGDQIRYAQSSGFRRERRTGAEEVARVVLASCCPNPGHLAGSGRHERHEPVLRIEGHNCGSALGEPNAYTQ
jgi:hypothetical protein